MRENMSDLEKEFNILNQKYAAALEEIVSRGEFILKMKKENAELRQEVNRWKEAFDHENKIAGKLQKKVELLEVIEQAYEAYKKAI